MSEARSSVTQATAEGSASPLGRERRGLRACDRDGLVAGLGVAHVDDGPGVAADLVMSTAETFASALRARWACMEILCRYSSC